MTPFRILSLLLLLVSPYLLSAEDSAPKPTTEEKPVSVITQPRMLSAYVPVYPVELYRQGIEGKVMVEIKLDKKGKVESATVIDSPNEGFNSSALYAAERFEFKPATKDGKAISVRARVNINFSLQDAVFEVKDLDTYAKPVGKFQISPPKNWKPHDGKKIEVGIDYSVNKFGRVSFIYLRNYTDEAIARCAVEAIKAQRFYPATLDGKNVGMICHMDDFKMFAHVEYIQGW